MKYTGDFSKREKLKEILLELAKSQQILEQSDDRSQYFIRLEKIYYNSNTDNFRHYYSDIFATLSLINGEPELGSLDILAQNIQTIVGGYDPKNRNEKEELIDVSKEILKLYDHINLEIARINYTNTMNSETKSELAKTKLLVQDLEEKAEKAEKHLKELTESNISAVKDLSDEFRTNQREMQKDYVAILGIFASIILTFTGAFAFSGSLLENIGNSSVYRLTLIACIIGIVFFDLIWLLIDFIREICSEKLKLKEKGTIENRTEQIVSETKCSSSKRTWTKWIWFGIVNAILIGFMFCTCFAYKYDWFSREPSKEIERVQVDTQNASDMQNSCVENSRIA